MTNHKHSLEQMMNSLRNLPWIAGAVAACAVLAAPAARAQTISTADSTPTSTAGSTPTSKPTGQNVGVGTTFTPLPSTSAPEAINVVSGTVSSTATVSVDPTGGATVVELFYDLSKLVLKGAKSGTAYSTLGQGRITRVLAASDQYVGTVPVWTTDANGKATYYTLAATFNMTFNTTTNVMTGLTVSLADYVAPATAGGVASAGTIE